jgi:hypothetical protein
VFTVLPRSFLAASSIRLPNFQVSLRRLNKSTVSSFDGWRWLRDALSGRSDFALKVPKSNIIGFEMALISL